MPKQQPKEIFVNAKEYRETTNSNEYLRTCEMDSCVGLALVEDLCGIRKRGLTYISYDTSNCYDKNGVCRLSSKSKQRGNKILEKIVSQFMGLEGFEKFPEELEDAEGIRAYVVANRTKQEKIKGNGTENGLSNDIGEVNPMFDFILNWLCKKDINLALSDSVFQSKREADELDNRVYPIHTKVMILHPNKLNILYMDNNGKILNSNPKTHSHSI